MSFLQPYQDSGARAADPNYQPMMVREDGGYGRPMPAEAASEPNPLYALWHILWRRKGTVLLAALLGLIAAVLLSLVQTPLYRARAALEILDMNNDFLNRRQISPTSDIPAVNTAVDLQTQQRILQSEDLLDQAIEKLKALGELKPLEEESKRLKFWEKEPLTAAAVSYRMRLKAEKSLIVRPLGQTKLLEVLYSSGDPKFAADFVRALVGEYVASSIDERLKMNGHIGDYLTKQLNDVRTKLQESESALQKYALNSGLLYATPLSGAPDKTNVSEDKLLQIQGALSKAQADVAAAQSRYEIAKSAAPETVADVLNDSSLKELQAKITDLARQNAELTSIYTPKSENVERVQAQIEPLQAAFDKKRSSILTSIRHDYETATRRQKLLNADFAQQAKVVTSEAHKSIEYNILKRDVDSNRQIYNSMLEEVKQATIVSAVRATNVRVVDASRVPVLPYWPNIPLDGIAGLFFGTIGGMVYVCLRERSNSTLRSPGDTRLWTSLPELGVIPSASLEAGRRNSRKAVNGRTPRYIAAQNVSKRKQSASLLMLAALKSEPRESLMGEAFRAILTSLMVSGENGSRPRLLVFTSGNPSEGKTTVVTNLGLAMAQVRQKVLIIDADLRSPSMHQLFNLDNTIGLSNLLEDQSGGKDLAEMMIQATSVPRLNVLTSGPATSDPAHLLYAPHFAELLASLKEEYDAVLVDTPPSLHFADARIIARLCDAVVLVTRAGLTTGDEAFTLQERFMEDKTRVLGSILNDWHPTKASSGAYRSSYYGVHRN